MFNNDAIWKEERKVTSKNESIMFHFARMEQNELLIFYLSWK
jgi:hypothetical protein